VTDRRRDTDSTVNSEMEEAVEGQVEESAGELASDEISNEESPLGVLARQLGEAQALADSHLDQWRRTAAEFSNYKKRTERERIEFQKSATAGFIMRLLPTIDDLDRAFENLPGDLSDHDWVNGIQMVRQKLNALLDQEGVETIDCADGSFDPAQHEAITYEENDEHDEGEIIDVFQKGYRIGERVLRPAQVRVAK